MKTIIKQGLIVTLTVSGAFAVQSNTAAHNNYSPILYKSDAATELVAFEVSRENAIKKVSRSRPTLAKFQDVERIFNAQELKDLLYLVGFRGQNLKEAWCIVMRESNGRPLAHNRNNATGDNSYGLFQINMIGGLGPDRREKFNLDSNNDLFNPVKNAQIAYYMSNGGTNWDSWHGMNADAKKWIDKFLKI